MVKSRFMHDPDMSVPYGTYLPPLTVPELLERMELTDAKPEHKRAGIEAWLSCHEPAPLLQIGLIREGYLKPAEATT